MNDFGATLPFGHKVLGIRFRYTLLYNAALCSAVPYRAVLYSAVL